ncbi:SPRY domain-containing protein [Viridibacillus sp. NPDC096237]|uniref:SPRY domain-containing protein n=1 Tax=Viridibacillus sp. NPDC096237 TaxID=3390721 RepID=UPI003D08F80C
MAKVGDKLTVPEIGWKRYDDSYPAIKYDGLWEFWKEDNNHYDKTLHLQIADKNGKIKFKAKTSRIRLVMYCNSNKGFDFSNSNSIFIDGINEGNFSLYNTFGFQALVYEKSGLSDDFHDFEIVCNDKTKARGINLDAIDIDVEGCLLHPDEVTNIKDLTVGKRIRCHYQASANLVGQFSGLGEETLDFIPIESSAMPNGDFYFIMVEDWNGKKCLIADRNIQHSISWDTLNADGIVVGRNVDFEPVLFDSSLGTLSLTNNSTTVTGDNGIRILNSLKQSGKWYIEFKMELGYARIGIAQEGVNYGAGHSTNKNVFYLTKDGTIEGGAVESSSYCRKILDTDIVGMLLDIDNGVVSFSINGEFQGIAVSNLKSIFTKQIYIYGGGTNSTPNTSRVTVFVAKKDMHFPIPNGFDTLSKDNSEYSLQVRLLTGGISNTDKDNEWDKYIVNSTLNDLITAGDNNVWNWNVRNTRTWTSSTGANSSYRVARGNSASGIIPLGIDAYHEGSSSDAAVARAFRPVLEIETLKTTQKKSLIYHDSKYKKWIEYKEADSINTITPILTGYSGQGLTVSATSEYSTARAIWYAFNGVENIGGNDWLTKLNVLTGTINMTFAQNQHVSRYSLSATQMISRAPKKWRFEYSLDGSKWIIADDVSYVDSPFNSLFSMIERNIETVVARYFRFVIIQNSGSTEYLSLSKIALYSHGQSTWEVVSTTTPTVGQFQEHGMDSIPTTKLPLLGEVNNIGIVTWVSDENHSPIVNLSAIPHNQLVLPTKDINIRWIENIDYIKLTVNELNHGRIRVITSFDGGLKWHTINGMKWIEVSPIVGEAIMHGMSAATLAAVTSTQWAELRGTSNTIRFAYALSIEDTTDVGEIDSLITQMDMKGTWKKAVHGKDYDYEYPNNDELQVIIYADGDYKINY